MNSLRLFAVTTALVSIASVSPIRAEERSPLVSLESALAKLNALPEPEDDPLLDASGKPVYDPFGKPISDPDEKFHEVRPRKYDPAGTHLVQSKWLGGIGCPSDAAVAAYPSTQPTGTYFDPVCVDGDRRDEHVEGLLMAKTGPTLNNAAATAELKKVRGTQLTELGYDIRKVGPDSLDPRGSHCGAGAPRFDIYTTDGKAYFIGCNSPPAAQLASGNGWMRMRWGAPLGVLAYDAETYALVNITGVTVKRILIVFDEGQDVSGGPDQFGAAILDNIDVNGTLVGRGAREGDD